MSQKLRIPLVAGGSARHISLFLALILRCANMSSAVSSIHHPKFKHFNGESLKSSVIMICNVNYKCRVDRLICPHFQKSHPILSCLLEFLFGGFLLIPSISFFLIPKLGKDATFLFIIIRPFVVICLQTTFLPGPPSIFDFKKFAAIASNNCQLWTQSNL